MDRFLYDKAVNYFHKKAPSKMFDRVSENDFGYFISHEHTSTLFKINGGVPCN